MIKHIRVLMLMITLGTSVAPLHADILDAGRASFQAFGGISAGYLCLRTIKPKEKKFKPWVALAKTVGACVATAVVVDALVRLRGEPAVTRGPVMLAS